MRAFIELKGYDVPLESHRSGACARLLVQVYNDVFTNRHFRRNLTLVVYRRSQRRWVGGFSFLFFQIL